MSRPPRITVASPKNQINTIATAFGFGEPMRKCFFRFISDALKRLDGSIDMLRPQIEIEVLCPMFREIVNNILEITACRLSWNEPVSNNDSARHELLTISL